MFDALSSFLMNPGLALGAGAVASPILIHLLARRKFRVVRWAAMDFLLEAQRQNRRRIQLEQFILLMLRCLAVFLLALMVARPFTRRAGIASLLSGGGHTERIVVIDDSYSMGFRLPSGGTPFRRAVEGAVKLAEWLSIEAPSDALTVLTTSRAGEIKIAVPNTSPENLRQVQDVLSGLTASEFALQLPEAGASLAEFLRRNSARAAAAVYFLSDLQKKDWTAHGADSRDKFPPWAAPLEAFSNAGRLASFFLIDVSADSPANIAITKLTPAQPLITAGVPARFDLEIANHSPSPAEQLEFGVAISDHTLPRIIVPRLNPGQTIREPVEITFPFAGSNFLRVELAGAAEKSDRLSLDNNRVLALDVVPAVQVLIASGEPSADSIRDETYLLRAALRPEGRAASGNELTVVDEHELDSVDLAHHDLVILANVSRLSPGARDQLQNYVQAGGGLLVFLGDQADPAFYNEQLFQTGLLPARLGSIAQPAAGADLFGISDWDENHSIMQPFVGPLATALRQVRVQAFYQVDEPADRPTSQTSVPTTQPAGTARVIARFNDPERSAAIITRTFGSGTCYLITTSADQEWNDWGSSFSFVPMLLELVQHAARPAGSSAQVLVGDRLFSPVNPSAFRPHAVLRSPDYPVEPEFQLQVQSSDKDHGAFVLDAAGKSGLWKLLLTTSAGEAKTRFASVNPDPTESDLAPAGKLELEAALGKLRCEYIRDLSAMTSQIEGTRYELWWPILLAAIAVLMTEQALAGWFGRRG